MKNFDLFLGCLGNGITVCNKAVLEDGDYKRVAHISPAGNIRLYVSADYIPAADMERISAAASRNRAEFSRRFELLPDAVQYEKILDALPISALLEYVRDRRSIPEKLPAMREYYYSIT